MNFLFVCAFTAPYKGNFINSLENLEDKLVKKGHKVIYAFTKKAKEQEWCKNIAKRTNVYFLEPSRFKIKTYYQIRKIYNNEKIDIVHSHFELYDIPVKLMANKNIKVFWHLHDAIDYDKEDFIHRMLNKIQYKYLSANVKLISVCEYYRKQIVKLGMKEKNTITQINGIDIARIENVDNNRKIIYDFYTLGWDYYRKGVDIILNACEKLYKEGKNFKLLLNGNDATWEKLNEHYKNNLPNWLEKQEFVKDINNTIKQVGCFIQASRRETFSYAIAEMAYAGIDVISSNIEGTKWAKELPTVNFFESENNEELYLLLKKFLENEKALCSINDYKLSRNIIISKYSIDDWADNIIKIYKI